MAPLVCSNDRAHQVPCNRMFLNLKVNTGCCARFKLEKYIPSIICADTNGFKIANLIHSPDFHQNYQAMILRRSRGRQLPPTPNKPSALQLPSNINFPELSKSPTRVSAGL